MVPVITLEAVRNKWMTMMTARDGRNHVDDVIHMEFGAVRFILPQSQPENDNNNNTDDSHENHDDDLKQKYENITKRGNQRPEGRDHVRREVPSKNLPARHENNSL